MKFLKESATRKYGCLSTGPIGNAEKKKKFSLSVPMFQTCDPQGRASFDPRGIIRTNLVEVN